MKRLVRSTLFLATLAMAFSSQAQERYLDEVFTDADLLIQKDIPYGVNVDFLKNLQLLDPQYIAANAAQIQTEHNEIRDSIIGPGPAAIPTPYFQTFAADPSTIIKLTDPVSLLNLLKMDVYMPNPAVDMEPNRPVIVYIHTGNFLPPAINGGITGSKEDSAAVELCKQWAKRGYVAVAPNYRLGWNPSQGTSQFTKTYTLLNAVYRAIGDMKQVVRLLRASATTYGLDGNRIAVYGQGSGGYVALAYNSLDSWEETTLDKFTQGTGIDVIDTNISGNVDGLGGLLNFYDYQGVAQVDASIAASVNAGGALGDITWIDGNESPFITIHALRDEFAPFDTGTVIVPTTSEPVVDVNGPNTFMPRVNDLGLNDAFADLDGYEDPETLIARLRTGTPYTQDLANINVNTTSIEIPLNNAEGLYTLLLPRGESSPWEWWNEQSFRDYYDALVAAGLQPTETKDAIIAGADAGNPNIKSQSLTFIDTIQNFIHPRLMRAMQLGNWEALSVPDGPDASSNVTLYPNPAHNVINIRTKGNTTVEYISLYDVTGKAVFEQRPVAGTIHEFSVADLQDGIYFLKMKTNQGEITERVMVH